MTTFFLPNQIAFGDKAGLGLWLIGHYRQHVRYNSVLAAKTPPVIIDEFPILNWGESEREIKDWLNSHENWHQLIRQFANVTGADLSALDTSNPDQWYSWMDVHNNEHALIDSAFGVA